LIVAELFVTTGTRNEMLANNRSVSCVVFRSGSTKENLPSIRSAYVTVHTQGPTWRPSRIELTDSPSKQNTV